MTFFGSLWGEEFLVLKKFFQEGWIFFHFKVGTPYGEIAKIGYEGGGRGIQPYINRILYLFFYYLNLARLYSCIYNADCTSICLCYYMGTLCF